MNKRIAELLKQCTTEQSPWAVEGDLIDYEKFAQLIIAECSKVAWDNAWSAEHAEELSNAIESHFKE